MVRFRRVGSRLALLAAASLLSLALAEAILRAIGFTFAFAPERVEFGYPDPVVLEERFAADPDLFWVLPGYPRRLASLADQRPHLLFLGDSCTTGLYPRLFLERLRAAYPDATLSGAQLGVGGWSSYQGLMQLRRDVLPLRPRIVTLYYGWNDHWIGFGVEDKDIHRLSASWLAGHDDLRLVQLLLKAQLALRTRILGVRPERVAPEDFRANLTAMVDLARSHGIVPVLLTPPTSHQPGREPAYLAVRHLRDLSDLVPLHHRYVEIVREVAGAEDAVLCDLAARFDALPRRAVRREYFAGDGIHPTAAGHAKIAEFLLACFEASPELRVFFADPEAPGPATSGQRGSGPRTASRRSASRWVPKIR